MTLLNYTPRRGTLFMARFLVIIFMFLLVGCTTPPDKLSTNQRKQIYRDNQERLQFLYQWQMSGRFAIHYERGGDTLNVDWIQYYREYGIKLSGPMNMGAAYLIGDKNGVTYKDGKGHEDHAPSPEAILQAYTGYLLPLSSLRYWLLGMPDPTMINDVTLNPQGYPTQMRQGPWTVDFGYFRSVGEYMLPHRLTMHHQDFSITLNISDWELKNIQPLSMRYKTKQSTQISPENNAQSTPAFEIGTDITPETSDVVQNTSTEQQKTSTQSNASKQNDPATSSSLAGESFPPKKKPQTQPTTQTTAKAQAKPQPKPQPKPRPKPSTSPAPQYHNETSGTDMTDTSMHP